MSQLQLLPAVDIRGGRASQVLAGEDADPWAAVSRWLERGATWLHAVDLDRAFGTGDNAAVLQSLIDRVPVPVQLSGGITSPGDARQALATAAQRVVISSAALLDIPQVLHLTQEDPQRVAVAVDVAHGQVVARGTNVSVGPLQEVLPALVEGGCRTVLLADASRDGSRRGLDRDLVARAWALCDGADSRIVVSGGVATLADVAWLRDHEGVAGVVLGSALYHGNFTLEQATQVAHGVSEQGASDGS